MNLNNDEFIALVNEEATKVITNLEKTVNSAKVSDRYVVYVAKDQNRLKIYDALEQKFVVDFEQRFMFEHSKLQSYTNGVFLISEKRKLLIIKPDEVKGMITLKYETDFDFEFDVISLNSTINNNSVLKTKDYGSLHFNLHSKIRKDGLLDYVDVF